MRIAGIRRPYRQLVQQPAVVDLEQRRDVGRLLARRCHRVRMRPVGAPDDAVGIRGDQRRASGDAVGIIGREFGGAIGAGDLHIGLARPHQLHQVGEARLLRTEFRLGAAEMVEHDRHGRGGDEVLDRGDHRRGSCTSGRASCGLHALDRRLEALPADVGIADAAGRQIEPDAAHAGLAHGVEIALRRLVVDDGDAARVGAARLHAVQRRGIVGAVDARRDDHHALHVQRLVERRHLLGQRQLRRIDAPRRRTETSRDRRGCGYGKSQAPAGHRRNSPASMAVTRLVRS